MGPYSRPDAPGHHHDQYTIPMQQKLWSAVHKTSYRWPRAPRDHLDRFTVHSRHSHPRRPGARWHHPINIQYLDSKNYGSLYAEPVVLDLVHPETTLTNIPYLDTENYGALYIEPVTDDLVHLETTSFILPYLDNQSPSTWWTRTPPWSI